MRGSRRMFKLGMLVATLLAGLVALLVVRVGVGPAVRAVTFAPVTLSLLVLGVIVALAVVLMVVRLAEAGGRKRKNDDLDPYVTDMVDRGVFHLEDDGELPEWVDILDDKPKRAEE